MRNVQIPFTAAQREVRRNDVDQWVESLFGVLSRLQSLLEKVLLDIQWAEFEIFLETNRSHIAGDPPCYAYSYKTLPFKASTSVHVRI